MKDAPDELQEADHTDAMPCVSELDKTQDISSAQVAKYPTKEESSRSKFSWVESRTEIKIDNSTNMIVVHRIRRH